MRYLITESISKTYMIEAENKDEALAIAFEIDDTWKYEESFDGFTHLIELDTHKEWQL